MRRQEIGNAFEFVAVASARAKQLLKGCTPRVDTPDATEKPARVAQREVLAGVVRKMEPEPAKE
jgi:DNA-directed RNA polymerase subunit K/omega